MAAPAASSAHSHRNVTTTAAGRRRKNLRELPSGDSGEPASAWHAQVAARDATQEEAAGPGYDDGGVSRPAAGREGGEPAGEGGGSGATECSGGATPMGVGKEKGGNVSSGRFNLYAADSGFNETPSPVSAIRSPRGRYTGQLSPADASEHFDDLDVGNDVAAVSGEC